MSPQDYKEAAEAITSLRWMLAAAIATAGIEHEKTSKKRMARLSELRGMLEAEAMKTTPLPGA